MSFQSLAENPTTSCCVVSGPDDIRKLIASLFEQDPKPTLAYGVSDMDMLEEHFPEFQYSGGNQARLQAGVPSRALYTSQRGPVYTRLDHLLLRESRYLPPGMLKPCGDMTIVGDTVVLMAIESGQPVALAIKSSPFAEQMRGLFNILWSISKRTQN